jgi:membrane-bound lytic murein transglycosylase D
MAACIALAVLARSAEGAPNARRGGAIPFPAGLEEQVQFWKDVFTIYTTKHVVIHDRDNVTRIYSVLDFSYLDDGSVSAIVADKLRRERVADEIDRVQATLARLSREGQGSPLLSPPEEEIARLFPPGTARSVFRAAAEKERIRSQTGLSEKFRRAIEVGHAYWPAMERIFRSEGLPVELTRLPLVESGFNLDAYSKTGAAGVWQFMPATGRLYLRIDEAVDERRDPIASTRAAAQFLRENYELLGTWPLAVTAYNHGRGGMARAVSQLGTQDLVTIIKHYKGRVFGFASKNFYAEFLAALEVERNAAQYFGRLQPLPPRDLRGVVVPDYVRLSALAGAAGMSSSELAAINPALSGRVTSGDLYVPRGYELWLPPSAAARFDPSYRRLAAAEKHERQKQLYVVHKVRRGETLAHIARRYRTTVKAIMRQNGLRNGNRIRVGQRLRISAQADSERKPLAFVPRPSLYRVITPGLG